MKLGPKNILAGLFLSVLLVQTQLWAGPKPKYSAALTDLWVIQTSSYNGNESAIGSALAGFVNSQNGSNMIWQEYGGSNPVILANELQGQGVVIHNVTSVWQLVQQFRGFFNQGVQYTENTPSINVAFSLCGLWNDIPIEDGEVATAASYGVNIAFNADGLNDAWTFANYGSQFTKGMAVDLEPGNTGGSRDFGIAHKAFFFSDQNMPTSVDTTYAQAFGPACLFYGYIWNEYPDIQAMSQGGGSLIVTDLAINLEALSVLPPIQPLKFPKRPAVNIESNVSYVAFVMTDGDNIGFYSGDFATANAPWWLSPLRGQFPMTWEISPFMAQLAPLLMEYFYNTATPNDGFVGCAEAPGYNYPYDQPSGGEAALASKGAAALLASQLTTTGEIDDPNGGVGSMGDAAPLVNFPNVQGAVYKVYGDYNQYNGATAWSSCKPIVSEKFGLYMDGQYSNSPPGVAAQINALPTSPLTNQASYALVSVSVWDDWSTYNPSEGSVRSPLWAVQNTISQLNSNVRVVTADQIVAMMQSTFGGCGFTPTPTPTSAPCAYPGVFGYNTAGAGSYLQAGWLSATSYPLSYPATINSLGVYMTAATVDAIGALGIYSDNGGTPGTLLVQSNTQSVSNGWNVFNITPTYLPPGNYWFGNSFGGATANVGYDNGTATTYYTPLVFTGILPKTFTPTGNHMNNNISLYANICLQPTPTATFTPTTTPPVCASWVVNGTASLGTAVTLTTAVNGQTGTAWNSSTIDLTKNFNMTFKAYFGAPGGADGIDFVLQNDPRGTAALGGGGGNKGYTGGVAITPSVAFDLETYNSNGTLQMLENGNPANTCTYAMGTCPYVFPSNISNSAEHTYQVAWSAAAKQLMLIVDGTVVMVYNRDLVASVFGNNSKVYYGFTAATGGSNNLQYVYEISCVNATPTFTATFTPTMTVTATNTSTATGTPTPTNTATNTATNTKSSTATNSPTCTTTQTATTTPTSTPIITGTSTNTVTITPSSTPTHTPTNTVSSTPTQSSTNTPTNSVTRTATNAPTATSTYSKTFTPTGSSTNTPTSTAVITSTFSDTATHTASSTPTHAPNNTPTATPTPSATNSSTNSPTLTATNTPTVTSTYSKTNTPTESSTNTATNSATSTFTPPSTSTPTDTPTITETYTPTHPSVVVISAPYPNPSTGSSISFDVSVPDRSTLTMDVFTLAFRNIASQNLGINGNQTFHWDLKDHSGVPVSDGIYYVRIRVAGNPSVTKVLKVLVLR
jgi:hypothetical protein